jgi:hypothetical protein
MGLGGRRGSRHDNRFDIQKHLVDLLQIVIKSRNKKES